MQQQTERERLAEKLATLNDAHRLSGPSRSIIDQAAALLRGDEPAKPVDPVESLLDEIVNCATLDETGKHYHFESEAMVSAIRHALKEAEARGRNEAFRLNNQPSSGVAPPAKPDRYVEVAREVWDAAWKADIREEREFAIAAVLRKHFPSVEVPEDVAQAAYYCSANYADTTMSGILARFIKDHILKGDQ